MSSDAISTHIAARGLPDPATIRSQLPPDVAVVFDREWELVLEDAKRTQDLRSILDLVIKWRFFAHEEAARPGSYFRMLDVAERILAAGSAEAAGIKTYNARAVIESRLRSVELPDPVEGAYSVSFVEDVRSSIDALPTDAVTALAEVVTALEAAPHARAPQTPPAP